MFGKLVILRLSVRNIFCSTSCFFLDKCNKFSLWVKILFFQVGLKFKSHLKKTYYFYLSIGNILFGRKQILFECQASELFTLIQKYIFYYYNFFCNQKFILIWKQVKNKYFWPWFTYATAVDLRAKVSLQ